jgi:hypothetical protein
VAAIQRWRELARLSNEELYEQILGDCDSIGEHRGISVGFLGTAPW